MTETIFIQLTKEELVNLINQEVTKAVSSIKQEPKYLTRSEVCERLKITLGSLHNYMRQGKIEALKIHGRTLFDSAKIDEAVERKTVIRYGRA